MTADELAAMRRDAATALSRLDLVLYTPPDGDKVMRTVASPPKAGAVRLFGHKHPVPTASVKRVRFGIAESDPGPGLSFGQLFLAKWQIVVYAPPGGEQEVRQVAERPRCAGDVFSVKLFGTRDRVPLEHVCHVSLAREASKGPNP